MMPRVLNIVPVPSKKAAFKTKDLPFLNYGSFQLAQLDDGQENGTALWLGAQVMAQYLIHNHSLYKKNGSKAIELGSGIGLSALVLASLNWNVLATDQAAVLNKVLARNIAHNSPAVTEGSVSSAELDWTVEPDRWTWDEDGRFVSASHSDGLCTDPKGKPEGFNLIITSDTIYSPALVQPLLRTLHTLSSLSTRHPPILLCIERRDPALIDRLLHEARTEWEFEVQRIPQKKLGKAMAELHWEKEDWEGVEMWKLQLRSS